MTSANTADQLRNTAQPGMFANITDKDKQAPEELQRFLERQNLNSSFTKDKTLEYDASPKRTDYIDDWAGGSTTGGGSASYTVTTSK